MGLVRWLRETASRQVPQWMLYFGVAVVLGVLILFHYVLGFDWLQTIGLGLVVAVAITSVAKLIWAAANPPSDPDDRIDS